MKSILAALCPYLGGSELAIGPPLSSSQLQLCTNAMLALSSGGLFLGSVRLAEHHLPSGESWKECVSLSNFFMTGETLRQSTRSPPKVLPLTPIRTCIITAVQMRHY